MFGVLLWGQETKFCGVFDDEEDKKGGEKKRRALAKALAYVRRLTMIFSVKSMDVI